MKNRSDPPRRSAWALPLLLVTVGCAGRGLAGTPGVARDTTVVDGPVPFHGWSAWVMRRGPQRVTVVPAIGRVMGIDLADDGGSAPAGLDPFWSHPQLGADMAPDPEGWINFGGDKVWPAPQSAWPTLTGRGWPPPATFDAKPYLVSVGRSGVGIPGGVEILSAVDPAFGIRVRRRLSLSKDGLEINTSYEKVQGESVRVAVWTITQLRPPERMFVLLPGSPAFAGGFRSLLPTPPRDARVDGRLLSLARDPAQKTMIASDGDALLWVGEGRSLVIEKLSESLLRGSGQPRAWPDGAHAQIYTSPDGDQRYIELELLGPLVDLRPGQSTEMLVRYRLLRRVEPDPLREAQRIFAPKLRD